jgi:HEPN domain-containing protein
MDRATFQDLARLRLLEAETLLTEELWDGAYYLAGYAVECGLKACIARQTVAEAFPPEPRLIQKIYTHDLRVLLKAARLDGQLEQDAPSGSALDLNWGIVYRWNESSRYDRLTADAAQALIEAIRNPQNGVLQWLEQNW